MDGYAVVAHVDDVADAALVGATGARRRTNRAQLPAWSDTADDSTTPSVPKSLTWMDAELGTIRLIGE
jgi:hypothetical protein